MLVYQRVPTPENCPIFPVAAQLLFAAFHHGGFQALLAKPLLDLSQVRRQRQIKKGVKAVKIVYIFI